jgi:CheY-like chemotaxis protein
MAIERIPAPLQVYIVEDSPIIQRLLASTIEASGAELLGRSSKAQTAIAELSMLQPDLILIDIILDVGSGFDVLRVMQERGLAPAAIKAVLTNHATADYEALSYRLGAHRFFDKGTETSQVLALIDVLSMEKRHKTMHPPDTELPCAEPPGAVSRH